MCIEPPHDAVPVGDPQLTGVRGDWETVTEEARVDPLHIADGIHIVGPRLVAGVPADYSPASILPRPRSDTDPQFLTYSAYPVDNASFANLDTGIDGGQAGVVIEVDAEYLVVRGPLGVAPLQRVV